MPSKIEMCVLVAALAACGSVSGSAPAFAPVEDVARVERAIQLLESAAAAGQEPDCNTVSRQLTALGPAMAEIGSSDAMRVALREPANAEAWRAWLDRALKPRYDAAIARLGTAHFACHLDPAIDPWAPRVAPPTPPPTPPVKPAVASFAGTTWQFCDPPESTASETVTLLPGGAVAWDSDCGGSQCECGDARWEQHGSALSFDCAAFTQYEGTVTGDELHGTWYRTAAPSDRAPTCLRRVAPRDQRVTRERLAGTTWQFCDTSSRVTFEASGTAAFDMDCGGESCDCGDAHWTLDGDQQLHFDCAGYTQYEAAMAGSMMHGEWYRTKNPADRGATCLERVQ